MDFFDMVQKLQLIYGMKIILISCGSFYITIGFDAVVLNKELGLKLNCAKRGMDRHKKILETGDISGIIEVLGKYLSNLSNRDYKNFDEKYVKVIFYSLAKMLGTMLVKSELEVGIKYSDILMIPREKITERYGILIEFKYIKKEDYSEEALKQKQDEAKKQLEKYLTTEEIKMIPKLKSYSVIAVKDELIAEEIE